MAGRDIFFEHTEPSTSTVAFSRRRRPITSVTVPAHASTTIDVRIAPDPTLSEGAIYGGYLVATPSDGDPAAARAVRRLQGRLPGGPGA